MVRLRNSLATLWLAQSQNTCDISRPQKKTLPYWLLPTDHILSEQTQVAGSPHIFLDFFYSRNLELFSCPHTYSKWIRRYFLLASQPEFPADHTTEHLLAYLLCLGVIIFTSSGHQVIYPHSPPFPTLTLPTLPCHLFLSSRLSERVRPFREFAL